MTIYNLIKRIYNVDIAQVYHDCTEMKSVILNKNGFDVGYADVGKWWMKFYENRRTIIFLPTEDNLIYTSDNTFSDLENKEVADKIAIILQTASNCVHNTLESSMFLNGIAYIKHCQNNKRVDINTTAYREIISKLVLALLFLDYIGFFD